jgi:putative SOS response-associated peptidase YedK
MCNHYRNNPDAIPTWREYIGAAPHEGEWSDIKIDVWPKYQGIIARVDNGQTILDSMAWGVPITLPGKREGTTVTKRVTNVRNLTSPFWRSMLSKPAQRCLVPFNTFAEPKPNAGRDEVWFKVTDSPVAAFAGIWRPSAEGNVYAFLTCEPNPLVVPIHPKAMPVILQPDDYERWLTGDNVSDLAAPFPSQLMSIEK